MNPVRVSSCDTPAARAIVASGFAQETHGAGMGRKGPAGFSAAAFAELDPSGRWVTTPSGKHIHIASDGSPDAGNPHVVGAAGKGRPGTGGNPLTQPKPTDPSAPPSDKGGGKVKGPGETGQPDGPRAGTGSGWGSWLAALGGGAAVAAARRGKSDVRTAPLIRNQSDRGGRGGAGRSGGGRGGSGRSGGGRGGSGRGGKGKGGKGGGGGAGQGRFNRAALVGIVDFLKQVQTGGVDTTGHGNTAINIGFSAAPDRTGGGAVAFGRPLTKKRHRLTDRHVKALGRIFMEEVRGAMTRAHLTRQDLHTSQDRHAESRRPKGDPGAGGPAAFAAASLAALVREGPGSLGLRAAQDLVRKLEAVVPPALLSESRARAVEIYPDQTGTQARADETQREGVRGVKGFFDRRDGLMVVSVVGSDCHNFFHELGHTFDHLLDGPDRDRIAAEWGGTHPENFAKAFTDLCMSVRAGHAARRQFCRQRPAVCAVAARYGFDPAAFSVEPTTRVARAVRAAESLVADLAPLAAGRPADYAAARTAAGVRVADAVSEFAAAVAPGRAPSMWWMPMPLWPGGCIAVLPTKENFRSFIVAVLMMSKPQSLAVAL